MNMSAQSHASSSQLMKKHDEALGLLPELRTAIPTVRAVTKQMQLAPIAHASPYLPQPQQKQLALAPRPFHQFQYHVPQQVYPPPLASHGEVVVDRDLFFSTLTKFHVTLGTKLTIPKIGGRDLDLHLLYKEVTARGGLEMVIHERKWKEITVVLNFPRTTTSASFVLRKYYINLLHHYEKVHFFQVQGPLVPPPVHATNSNPANQIIEVQHTQSALESPETETRKRKIDSAQALGVDPASSIGSIVTGSIDGKHEHGYLVTVMVGTRKMRGVLYHVPPCSTRPQGASVSSFMNSLETDLKTPARVHRMGRKQKKKEMSRKDPNAPRQNRTGYNFFFAEQRAKLKSAQPDKDRAISKMIGNLWNQLSEDEKSPYQDRGLEDKERYRREMREYKERLRLEGQGVVGTTDCQYKERLRLEGQGVARTTDYQNSLHVQRNNDHISNDAVHQVQLRLEGAKSPQEHCQSGSHNGFGVGICDNQSCGSGSALVEDHSINKAQSPKDLNPVPKDENPVMMLEQGAHG